WEPGRVEVQYTTSPAHGTYATSGTVTARSAMLTVPLSVLQQTTGESAIAFSPDIEDTRRAASQLAMGTVVRMVLLFREPFWESKAVRRRTGGRSLAELAFLHSWDGREAARPSGSLRTAPSRSSTALSRHSLDSSVCSAGTWPH